MGGAASRRPHAQTRSCSLQSAARLVEEAMPSHSLHNSTFVFMQAASQLLEEAGIGGLCDLALFGGADEVRASTGGGGGEGGRGQMR